MPNLLDGQEMLLSELKIFYWAIFPVIEGFGFLFYFVMVPLAYETNYVTELFLISFRLFDYAASKLQYFRNNKNPPELHWWWKIFVSRRKPVSQAVSVLVPGREKALLQNGVHLCLWRWLDSCPNDRLRSHWGSFPCLRLSICVCFTCQLTCLSLGWGREMVQHTISCGKI